MQLAGPYVDLVFHGLAFVPPSRGASPASRAASLHWPAYIERANGELPLAAWEPLEIDAALLSILFEPVATAHAIALFAELHESVAAFQRTARVGLAELGDADVASSHALHALRALPEQPVELFRAGLLLCARAFDELHRERFAPFAAAGALRLDAAIAGLDPVLRGLDLGAVRLSATLGPRGRGFPTGVVVGFGSPPGDAAPDPEPTLVMAVHERMVERAASAFVARGWSATWSKVEAVAIALERELTAGTKLEHAQREWLDAIDDSGLAALDGDLEQVVAELRAQLTRG